MLCITIKNHGTWIVICFTIFRIYDEKNCAHNVTLVEILHLILHKNGEILSKTPFKYE